VKKLESVIASKSSEATNARTIPELSEQPLFAARPSLVGAVFIDINGNREIAAVVKAIRVVADR
jgi:hypothetical protein